jgi:hypothetical protein
MLSLAMCSAYWDECSTFEDSEKIIRKIFISLPDTVKRKKLVRHYVRTKRNISGSLIAEVYNRAQIFQKNAKAHRLTLNCLLEALSSTTSSPAHREHKEWQGT